MHDTKHETAKVPDQAADPESTRPPPGENGETAARPCELGGRKGLDPVRYGDWEKNGRCIDF
ncbi:MAG: DUF1674 domain-containing protein [Wenzhouxiangellaceae bacterium]